MTPEERDLLRALLSEQRVLSLSVLLDGAPYGGLLPFAAQPDFSALLVHASGLAAHTAGLGERAAVGVLIHAPDGPGADPLQIARVSLQGSSHLIAKDSEAYGAALGVYVAKLPESEGIFGLGDFNLYALVPEKGRFVVGFGRAFDVSAETLRGLA